MFIFIIVQAVRIRYMLAVRSAAAYGHQPYTHAKLHKICEIKHRLSEERTAVGKRKAVSQIEEYIQQPTKSRLPCFKQPFNHVKTTAQAH